jgi:hypothetical protein
MNTDDARQQAERLFTLRAPDDKPAVPDYEARCRDIRQKIEYLRSLRLAAQRLKASGSDSSSR